MTTPEPLTLGEALRAARLARYLGLRELAAELGISPSYLSDIENDRRVPAESVLRSLCGRLGLDPDVSLAMGGRFAEGVRRYLKRTPSARELLRRIVAAGLDERDLARLIRHVGAQRMRT